MWQILEILHDGLRFTCAIGGKSVGDYLNDQQVGVEVASYCIENIGLASIVLAAGTLIVTAVGITGAVSWCCHSNGDLYLGEE